MSDFAQQWSTAKTKFEQATGLQKPAVVKTIPIINTTYRKGTGFESTLKELDEVLPDRGHAGVVSVKDLKDIKARIVDVEKAGIAYLGLLTGAIEKERNGPGGKAASNTYRDLKILRATLENVIAWAKRDFANFSALSNASRNEMQQELRATYALIDKLSENLEANCRKALVAAQKILKEPTAETFNENFKGDSSNAARNITQVLANIRKYTVPDAVSERVQGRRLEQMEDAMLSKAIKQLYHDTEKNKKAILSLLGGHGSSPLDADLEKLNGGQMQFQAGTPSDTIIKATKHFTGQVKVALQIAMDMKGQHH